MNRRSYALVLGLAICTVAFAETGTFSYSSPAASAIAPSNRAVTIEQEWIVSEIAGSMLNIAAFAGRFEPGDPFQVRSAGTDSSGVPRFKLTRRVEEYTITTDRPWTPAAYVRIARSLMADGAGLSVTEDAIQVQDVVSGARFSQLLHDHPRSGALQERAAYQLGLAAERPGGPGASDPRRTLCRMTAHLAIARALHPGAATKEGQLAEQTLLGLAELQRAAGPRPATAGDHPQFWILDPQ